MKKLKNTKREIRILSQFLAQRMNEEICGLNNSELYHVYKSFSREKQNSFDNIKVDMEFHNGKELRILSNNTFQYTCAYLYESEGNLRMRYFSRDTTLDFIVFTWTECNIRYSEYWNK